VLEIGILEEDGSGCEMHFAREALRFSNFVCLESEEMDRLQGKAGRCAAWKE